MEILIPGIISVLVVLYILNENKKKREYLKSIYQPQVNSLLSKLNALSKHFISFSELEVLKPDYKQIYATVERFSKRLHQELPFSDFFHVYKDLDVWREQTNRKFIDKELERTQSLFNDIDGKALDL